MSIPRKSAATLPSSHPDFIPAELRALPQWVCWHREERHGKTTKPPIDAKSNGQLQYAKVNDPATWSDFDTAVAAAVRLGLEGVGLALSEFDNLTCEDLDHVLNPDTYELTPEAAEVVERFADTYIEVSPSGDGLHIWCYGKAARSGKCEGTVKWLEVYSHPSNRHLTVTGNRYGAATAVTEQQAALDWLHTRFMEKSKEASTERERTPPPPVDTVLDLNDAALLDKARNARNGAAFAALYAGDTSGHNGDASAADLALCDRLAWWCNGDAARMDRMFRQSGLMRAKWDERRGEQTYGQITLAKARAGCREGYSGKPSRPAPPSAANGPSLDDVDDEHDEVTDEAAKTTADGAEILRLAALNLLDYDRQRGAAAKALGVRGDTLDKLVKEQRGDKADSSSGKTLCFPEITPYPQPVSGAELLNELTASVKRFVCLPEYTAPAIALWTAYSYVVIAYGHIAPCLAITSPEPRCGKSTLLGWLYRLVNKPMLASNITAAAIFRTIDAWKPTLLIDEADSFLGETGDELRGILNSGHTRDTAYVIRVCGDELEPRQFSTWGAKAVALIGKLEGRYATLADRSIEIQLRRRMATDAIEKLRHADTAHFKTLAARCLRFALDNGEAVGKARPDLPEMHDRAADNWEPLLAMADLASGGWPRLARTVALALSGGEVDGGAESGGSLGVQLLTDLHAYFAERTAESYPTEQLLRYLTQIDDAPWATFAKGKAMTPRHLSRLLQPYGIKPKNLWQAGAVAKGYEVADFKDAFARYLPSIRYAARSASSGSRSPDCVSAMNSKPSGYETASSASLQADPSGIADKKPESAAAAGVADKKPGSPAAAVADTDAATPHADSSAQPPSPPLVDFTGSLADRILAILDAGPNGLALRDLANATGSSEPIIKLTCNRLMMAGQVTLREGRYVAVQRHG
jgi:uncharacterized protein DUF3631/primase/DNA polymerase family protein